jgi:dihydroorotate dehydrogenase (NAD+) catalytic subunit
MGINKLALNLKIRKFYRLLINQELNYYSRYNMVDLSTEVAGLKLKNPTILASGILGETGKTLERVVRGGAAAVTTKSIGVEPRPGHINPTIVELDYGLLNAMGLPNPGIEEYKEELSKIISYGIPVLGSIFGKDADEFSQLAGVMADVGISALELNLSCPHTGGYGAELGSDPDMVKSITTTVKSTISIPLFVKLTPNTSDIVSLGRAAVDGGSDALVAINTVKGLALEPDLGLPILSNKIGGYSGPGIKPIGLRCVFELGGAELGIPIIGVGGITNGRDVVEYLMAGASAVQIGTAVYSHGITVFNKIITELEEFMKKNNYGSISQLTGLALKR